LLTDDATSDAEVDEKGSTALLKVRGPAGICFAREAV
jgi:hypothetical protein